MCIVCVLFTSQCAKEEVKDAIWLMASYWSVSVCVHLCTWCIYPLPPPPPSDGSPVKATLFVAGGQGGSPSPTGVCHPGCVRIKKRCADLTIEHRGTRRRPTQKRSCTGGLVSVGGGCTPLPPPPPPRSCFPADIGNLSSKDDFALVFYFLHVELEGQREKRLRSSGFRLTMGYRSLYSQQTAVEKKIMKIQKARCSSTIILLRTEEVKAIDNLFCHKLEAEQRHNAHSTAFTEM